MATTGRCEEGSVSLTPALSQGERALDSHFRGNDEAVGERPGAPTRGAPTALGLGGKCAASVLTGTVSS